MKLVKIRIKNYRSIKDSGDINISDNLYVLAGQNESGKSSILEALRDFENDTADKGNLNFDLENAENYIQEISCTYEQLDSEILKSILEEIPKEVISKNISNIPKEIIEVFDNELFTRIRDFTLTRTFDFSKPEMESKLSLDIITSGKLKGGIKKAESTEVGNENVKNPTLVPYIDVDQYNGHISEVFFQYTPKIVLFNDFSTLLPDKILLSKIDDKASEGYVAVRNLETLLGRKFIEISKKESRQLRSIAESESKSVSASFQEDWQQRIFGNNSVQILFDIRNNSSGETEIIFSIETKDGELLAPRRRSKGMIWFLSLWLELKAKEKGYPLILLFDEPGLHLHVNANRSMLKVFHKLIEKGHQIIYATHSPALIETNNLHNIGLVINDVKKGSMIEGLTTSKLNTENRRDALQPIAEAMGMEPLRDFTVLRQKNVIVEGLSDYWVFKGMSILLGKNSNYEFIPSIGIKISKVSPLISFCIGYGLDWLLVMDNGEVPIQTRNELKTALFSENEEETNKRVLLLPVPEIENMFDPADLIQIDSRWKQVSGKSPIDIIGDKGKILFAKAFYAKAVKGEIKRTQFDVNTIKRFEEIFRWIDAQFKS